MKFLDKIFHLKEKDAKVKNEIIGGLITFIAMCYILPINSGILSAMGMDKAGVFAITALVSFLVTMIMGLVANYPIVLSTGMGLNAYLAFTLSESMGFTSWQQKMILLTVAGLLFFIFSLTPVRKMIIEAIPKDLRCIISACLGGFILFVGLKGSGIIVAEASTLVTLGSFADPGMLLAFIAVITALVLTFSRKKMLSSMAIPITILIAAIVGVIISTVMINNGAIQDVGGTYVYNTGVEIIDKCAVNLPIAPWISKPNWGMSGVDQVFLYGLFGKDPVTHEAIYTGSQFVKDLGYVFSKPVTYVAIFSLMFVNLFDTTATLIAIGEKTGIIDENGKMQNYKKAVLADATGALICAPLGTSTVTSFAESNVGVSLGAKTGLAAVTAALLFLLSAFIYPVFSIFTAGSVTAAALVAVGTIITVNGVIGINKNDMIACFTAVIAFMFAVLTYSISNGIGVGLIVYVLAMLIARRGKEINIPVYVIAALFLVAFALSTVINLI